MDHALLFHQEVIDRVCLPVLQAAFAVALVIATGQVYAQSDDTPEPDTTLVDAAEASGVDPVDLAGAVNTTGMAPREYLYAVGELE
ncbi:MAG TPA: hypothetical protein VK348_05490, partial [Planctomycetota bacterium]|nr:hypothetical protein [Planctomycetota bacterium]